MLQLDGDLRFHYIVLHCSQCIVLWFSTIRHFSTIENSQFVINNKSNKEQLIFIRMPEHTNVATQLFSTTKKNHLLLQTSSSLKSLPTTKKNMIFVIVTQLLFNSSPKKKRYLFHHLTLLLI